MMTAMMIKTEDSFSVLHLQYNCPSIRSAPFAAAILQLHVHYLSYMAARQRLDRAAVYVYY